MSEPHLHDHRDDDPHHECAHEIATLRAQVIRRDKEISDLRHEIESARDAARGENALRLEAHLKLAAEKAVRDAVNKFGFE